ncbi:MAG: translation elongation factor Ts [Deltaproteobacteria bacterium]|nr:translation elongation factor Ts [Deltaproteobacteria bacterium]
MEVSAASVKELREKTGAGFVDCKKALEETNGDIEKAVDFLRQKGLSAAAKKSGRIASEGVVGSYIHGGGKIGVLIEVNCETDFVAKNEDFLNFVKDVCMHIAAVNPVCVERRELPHESMERERAVVKAQALESGKPEKVIEKIVEGRMEKFYAESCLLEQPFVKNPDITISDYLNQTVAKIGEKISIRRFTRYQMGEGLEKKSADFAAEVAAAIK